VYCDFRVGKKHDIDGFQDWVELARKQVKARRKKAA
jgi:hypothetical protein